MKSEINTKPGVHTRKKRQNKHRVLQQAVLHEIYDDKVGRATIYKVTKYHLETKASQYYYDDTYYTFIIIIIYYNYYSYPTDTIG